RGTSKRSARAVLRLIANSNLVHCTTGRSAGLAPAAVATLPTQRPLRGELILARCPREPTTERDDGPATAPVQSRLNTISLLLIARSGLRHRLEACRAKQPPEPVEQHVSLPFDPGQSNQRRDGA